MWSPSHSLQSSHNCFFVGHLVYRVLFSRMSCSREYSSSIYKSKGSLSLCSSLSLNQSFSASVCSSMRTLFSWAVGECCTLHALHELQGNRLLHYIGLCWGLWCWDVPLAAGSRHCWPPFLGQKESFPRFPLSWICYHRGVTRFSNWLSSVPVLRASQWLVLLGREEDASSSSQRITSMAGSFSLHDKSINAQWSIRLVQFGI